MEAQNEDENDYYSENGESEKDNDKR